jgi:hypothetical protein
MQAPDIQEHGLGWRFTWTNIDICIDQIRETASMTKAEMHVRYILPTGFQTLALEDVNLKRSPSRQSLVKHLVELDTDPDKQATKKKWMSCIEYACTYTMQQRRRGEPAVRLCPSPTVRALTWRVNPLVYQGQPTVMFAPGGSGKSCLGLLAAMLIQAGGYFAPTGTNGEKCRSNLCGLQGEVLYLDWEADRQVLELRWANLQKGHEEYLGVAPPYYRRMDRSLADDLREIQRAVADHEIKLVIIDSLAPAAGGDPNAPETAITFHKALRALKVSSLSLAHVAKNDEGKTRTIFGSAFFTNLARSVWELIPSETEGPSVKYVTLYHTKVNDGPKQRPLAFKIDFQHTSGGTHIEPIGTDELPSPEGTQSSSDKIRSALRDGSKSIEEIAQVTGLTAHVIRSRLSDGRNTWCTKVQDRWTLLGQRK